jgi:hypothetical protein|tara:strand:+ start:413 stop:604 length:192 start_codon:yes stop_codon:yes gene_type:complete
MTFLRKIIPIATASSIVATGVVMYGCDDLKKIVQPKYDAVYSTLRTNCPYLNDKSIEDIVPKK